MNFFGSKKPAAPPKPRTLLDMSKEELDEAQKAIKKDLQTSARELDRNIFSSKTALKSAQKKLEQSVKKKDDKTTQKIYAKNVLQARSGMERLMKNKVKIQDVSYGIDDIFSNIKMTRTMGNASHIMAKVAGLTNINEITQIATNLQTNLTKMGVIGEMVDDALEDMNEDTVGDDQAVDKLLNDVQDKLDPEKVKAKGGQMQMDEHEDNLDDMLNDLKN